MPRITELLNGKDDQIDCEKIFASFPWLLETEKNCILSPDSDGFLCGLFFSHFLNWNVVGYYDGKILICKKGISPSTCVFLDMDICRRDIYSVGHHMLLYNKNQKPQNWTEYENCLQPNILRNYDCLHDFRLKYPLATIHMILAILGKRMKIDLPKSAIPPLFFADGAFNVLFKYPENVLNWLNYLRAADQANPLNSVFMNNKCTVHSIMCQMDRFFRERDKYSVKKMRGDQLKISEKDGSPANLHRIGDLWNIKNDTADLKRSFIQLMSDHTKWKYKETKWCWNEFNLIQFSKSDIKGDKRKLNGTNFLELMTRKPLSWAITSGDNLEYTLEEPDLLF